MSHCFNSHLLLIHGYCKEQEKIHKITFHEDIINVCIQFHGPFYEIMTFDKELNISCNQLQKSE